MAFDEATLINEIEAAYEKAENNPGSGNRVLAEDVSAAIKKAVLSSGLNVPALGIKDSLNVPCTGASITGNLV